MILLMLIKYWIHHIQVHLPPKLVKFCQNFYLQVLLFEAFSMNYYSTFLKLEGKCSMTSISSGLALQGLPLNSDQSSTHIPSLVK